LTLAAALLGGLVTLLVVVTRPRHRDHVFVAPEAAQAPAPAYRSRLAYPSVEAPPPAALPAEELAAAAAPAAPFAPPPLVIPDDRGGPPAAKQTTTAWIGSFRDAVCACKTRACVRDLQAGFIHALGGTSYDPERDGAAYSEASHAAIRCYAQLPADS
jgi:hypothetical protein